MASADPANRSEILMLLDDGHAHMGFDEAVAEFPVDAMNQKVPNAPYTPWHILEHMRLTQLDSLRFVRDPDYTGRSWPGEYWPARDATADEAQWQETIRGFKGDLADFKAIAADANRDLHAPVPSDPERSILRSIYIVAAHNHYHIGEFAALRQVMGTWGATHEGVRR